MDVMLRCSVPDRPGALAALAGAIGRAGGDIAAVEVTEQQPGRALDDLVIALPRGGLTRLLAEVEAVEGVEVLHAGPSRGQPGDVASRFAVAVEAMLNGAMTPERGVTTLVGGLLQVADAAVVPAADAPRSNDRRLVLPLDGRALVLRRDYPFTTTERQRALALARLCDEVHRHVQSSPRSG